MSQPDNVSKLGLRLGRHSVRRKPRQPFGRRRGTRWMCLPWRASQSIFRTGLNKARRRCLPRASRLRRSTRLFADCLLAEEANATADDSRLIPPYNVNAAEPGDVYALHDIIPETEWRAIPVSALTGADSDENRIAALPHCRSSWVNQHLAQAFASDTVNKRTL